MNAIIAKSIVAVSLAAALTGYSGLAHADKRSESAGQVRSVVVRYAELDLSKPQGIDALYIRIQGAAKLVCRADSSVLGRYPRVSSSKCYQDAIERAVTQVNLVKLTALHRARTSSALG